MSTKKISIKVEEISKCYRIGSKKTIHDNFFSAVLDLAKDPIKNYRKYRSLYKFDDLILQSDHQSDNCSDIIWALRDVSFNIRKGEAVGIIGRNGAGKSTLLKILSRVTDPTMGRAEVRGKISSLLEVGTGFHNELTGRENVYLNGTILGMTKKEVDRKFDKIVDFSGIEKFIDTPVKRYSSGMKLRLAFSVAAHLEPDILLVDEVLAVGDADFQRKCLKRMEYVGDEGRTVLFVSHNMPAVTRLCKRSILLEQGRVILDGPSHQVVSTYLSSGSDTCAFREWPDPSKAPGTEVARLRAVRVRTEDGKIADGIDIRQDFSLEMEYEVLRPGFVLLPDFRLRNEQNDIVFVTVDQDPTWRRRPRPPGHYVSSAWIPGNLLAEGKHYVDCFLLRLFPTVMIFSELNAVAFQVIDSLEGDSARGDYSKDMPGVVRPLLKWTTEFNHYGDKAADTFTARAKL